MCIYLILRAVFSVEQDCQIHTQQGNHMEKSVLKYGKKQDVHCQENTRHLNGLPSNKVECGTQKQINSNCQGT
jgi:hypothetical protein